MVDSDPRDSSQENSDDSISRVHYCPECKKPLRRIEGKMGPFWGCTGFPKCHATLNDLDGKPSTEINQHFRCPLCTRRMVKADADRGKYWFCSGYSKGCKVTLRDDNGRPETAFRCPDCGNVLIKRQGKNGEFWGCKSYPDCTTSFNDLQEPP